MALEDVVDRRESGESDEASPHRRVAQMSFALDVSVYWSRRRLVDLSLQSL